MKYDYVTLCLYIMILLFNYVKNNARILSDNENVSINTIVSNSLIVPEIETTVNQYTPLDVDNSFSEFILSLNFTYNYKLTNDFVLEFNGNYFENNLKHYSNIVNSKKSSYNNTNSKESQIECIHQMDSLLFQIGMYNKEPNEHYKILISLKFWIISVNEINDLIAFQINLNGNVIKKKILRNDFTYDQIFISNNPFDTIVLFRVYNNNNTLNIIDIYESDADINVYEIKEFTLYGINGTIFKIMTNYNVYFILSTSGLYAFNSYFGEDTEFKLIQANVKDFLISNNNIFIISNEYPIYLNIYYYSIFSHEEEYTLIDNKQLDCDSFKTIEYIIPQYNQSKTNNFYILIYCIKEEQHGIMYQLYQQTEEKTQLKLPFNRFFKVELPSINDTSDSQILIDKYNGILYIYDSNYPSLLKLKILHREVDVLRFSQINSNITLGSNWYVVPIANSQDTFIITLINYNFAKVYLSSFYQEFKCKFKKKGIYEQIYTNKRDCSTDTTLQICLDVKKVIIKVNSIKSDEWFTIIYKIIIWCIFGLVILFVTLLIVWCSLSYVTYNKQALIKEENVNNKDEEESKKINEKPNINDSMNKTHEKPIIIN